MNLDLNIIVENYRKISNFVFIGLIALSIASITRNLIAIGLERDFELKINKSSLPRVESDLFKFGRGLHYYSPIVERNIFDSQNRQPDEEKPKISHKPKVKRPAYSGPPVKSTMNASLIGTMVFSDPAYSFAKITRGSGRSSESESFYIGDSLFGEATVKRVERGKVYIKRNGRTEYLEIEISKRRIMSSYPSSRATSAPTQRRSSEKPSSFSSDNVKEVGDGKYVIDRKMLDKLLSNYNSILTQARAVPNFVDGKTNGFKIFAIKKGSIYSAIGIKNGDILTRVNNQDINNLEKVLSLFTQLRNESNISLDMVRGGRKMTHEYEIR